MQVHVAGTGLVMPGVENWQQATQVLSDPTGYELSAALAPMAKNLLPANERRRTTRLIQMALHCGQDAAQNWQGDLATVFASSCGDLEPVFPPGMPVSARDYWKQPPRWSLSISMYY